MPFEYQVDRLAELEDVRFLPATVKINDTLVRTWRVLVRHWTFLIVAALGSIWMCLIRLAWPSLIHNFIRSGPRPLVNFVASWGSPAYHFVTYWVRRELIISTVEAFAYAVICYAAFCDVRGLRWTRKEILSATFSRFVPLVGLCLINCIAWDLGFHFYVIPGLFVAAAFIVSTPVCLIERTGPLQSIRRSFVLMRGHFWTIFGVVGFWELFLQTMYRVMQTRIHNWRLSIWVIWPIVVIATAADATFAAVLYEDLRGIETDAVLPPAQGDSVDRLTARNEI